MQVIAALPIVAAAAFIALSVVVVIRRGRCASTTWRIPAALGALFFAFSAWAVQSEGLIGFWPEHTRSLWGNQIWFDLLLSIGAAWLLIVPRALVCRMHLLPWLALIVCTGSMGLLAMVARVVYLETRAVRLPP
jgi:hypothetical protein